MKKLGTLAATLAAFTMAATPAIAAAPESPAAKLSVAKNVKRTGANTSDTNQIAGASWILIAVAAVAVIVGIILITDDDDSPASP